SACPVSVCSLSQPQAVFRRQAAPRVRLSRPFLPSLPLRCTLYPKSPRSAQCLFLQYAVPLPIHTEYPPLLLHSARDSSGHPLQERAASKTTWNQQALFLHLPKLLRPLRSVHQCFFRARQATISLVSNPAESS